MKTRKMNYQQHLLYTNLVCQVLQYNDFHILIDLLNYCEAFSTFKKWAISSIEVDEQVGEF
jgi:hypothetical protein